MAIDSVPEKQSFPVDQSPRQGQAGKGVIVAIVLLILAAAQVYTLVKINSLRDSLAEQQAGARKEIHETLSRRLAAQETANAQHLAELKEELDETAQRMGSTGQELNRARAMVTRLQKEQQREVDSLRGEIAQKADQQQLGALSQDVSSTRTDLDSTKQELDNTRNELGMTRTEHGTLIARNHDEIEQLRKMGDRDYYEFTLKRNSPQPVAGVVLNLKKTNTKRHRFNVNLTVDDIEVEKKDRTINEPIFFYVSGSKKPFEIVVNEVKSAQVRGYLSTPKGARETAAR